jgi:predicted transposase/invertase (TIGR01784 family)
MTTRPHDALFKAAFETPAHAIGLLREIVPASIRKAIRWDTLKHEPGSFVDQDLGDCHSDLLFSVLLDGARVLLYLLLEHQSTNDEFMTVRMYVYLGRIYQQYRKEHGAPLPLVIPVVVCHAPEGWTAPVSLDEMFEPHPASVPGLAPFIPSFSLMIHDLAHVSDDELHQWALAAFPKLALWILRDGRNGPRLLRNLEQWAHALREVLYATHGLEAVEQLLRYIALVSGDMHFREFHAKLREQVPEAEEAAMTIAEELRQEGMEKGRQEGRVGVLEKLLTLKFGELSAEYAARIQSATDAQLELYIERILGARTIDAVFAS